MVANLLYLAESDYGDAAKTGKLTLSLGARGQYVLDNYATVGEAVEAINDAPFTIVAPNLPNGRAATMHLSLSDSIGDSLENLDLVADADENSVATKKDAKVDTSTVAQCRAVHCRSTDSRIEGRV